MRILCTGSAGFIGKHTCELLYKYDYGVMGIDKNDVHPSTVSNYQRRALNILECDDLSRAFDEWKPEAILHLAANSSLRKGIEDPVYDARNNIIGTINVLQEMKNHGCKRIVFASTSAVYSSTYADLRTEGDPIEPITPYGISKAACEMYIRASGLDYAILRYANVYGPGQKPIGENILIARALAYFSNGAEFQINGDGFQTRDWIYVEDVARANLMALESDIVNLVANISTNKITCVGEIVGMLMAMMDKPFHHIKRGPPIEDELRHVVMNNVVAKKVLGWTPEIDIQEGLQRTVEAWKKSESSIPVS